MEIITLNHAMELNLKYYFTGIPCKHGHISKRITNRRKCLTCKNISNAKTMAKKRASMSDTENKEKKYYMKSYHNKNKEKSNDKCRSDYHKNKDKRLAQVKQYAKNNKDKINTRHRSRYANDKTYKTGFIVRSMLRRVYMASGKEKARSIVDCLGYSKDDLYNHMQNLFLDGMSWDNHGKWHIDHIKPLSLFIKNGVTDPSIINALSNLQPLWASDNIIKSDRY